MPDPYTAAFANWSRLSAAWFDSCQTALRAARMAETSNEVISRRTELMGNAIRAPLGGDYAEFARFVPEKVEALSRSAAALSGHCLAMQTACLAQAQHAASLAMLGRAPSWAEWHAQIARTVSYGVQHAEQLAALSRQVLAPVDATVTANASRLQRGKPGARQAR